MTIAAISIITTVTRKDARFQQMADAIAGMIPIDHPISLEWVVVDRYYDEERAGKLEDIVADRFALDHTGWEDRGMRNTGLAFAFSEGSFRNHYVLFTDDSTVLTKSTLKVIELAYEKNVGLKLPVKIERNVRVPADGAVSQHEGGGLTLVPCSASSISPSAFGAPMAAFAKVAGFDDAYDDDYDRKSVDAAVRIERAGYSWMTTKRAVAIHMTVGHEQEQEDERKKSAPARDKANVPHWNALLADRDRFEPNQRGFSVLVAEPETAEPVEESKPAESGTAPSDPVPDFVAEVESSAPTAAEDAPAPVAELAEAEVAKLDPAK